MSAELEHLFAQNRAWADRIAREEPGFFASLAAQQRPEYLWIGCSDSRVPSNQIIGVRPGEVFVHRNVANMVQHADLNCLSAVEFAVKVLKVKHVIVCGHYGCGGVQAALRGDKIGIVDDWLAGLHALCARERSQFEGLDEEAAWELACELNVRHQVRNFAELPIVRECWSQGQELTVHGWIYGVADGLLRDLAASVSAETDRPSLDLP